MLVVKVVQKMILTREQRITGKLAINEETYRDMKVHCTTFVFGTAEK